MSEQPIRILHFSDVLCVWAYVGHARVVELQRTFGDAVAIDFHFVPVFGDALTKLDRRWRERGGLAAYGEHVRTVAAGFEHVSVHPRIWADAAPCSSTACHLFLHAVQLAAGGQAYARATWALRQAFFAEGVDVSTRAAQRELASRVDVDDQQIQAQIDSGAAYAALSCDLDLMREHGVTVSPTLLFNEGRQRLTGNVGYRVIEANVRELLERPSDQQSWC